MTTERERNRQRARDALAAEIHSQGLSYVAMRQRVADGLDQVLDEDTIVNFLEGGWPWRATQGRLEYAVGWPPSTIYKIEHGAEPPPLRLATPLAERVDELDHATEREKRALRAFLRLLREQDVADTSQRDNDDSNS